MPPKKAGVWAGNIAQAAAKPEKVAARQGLRRGRRANRQAYGALDRTLSGISDDAASQYQRLGSQFSQGVSGLSGLLNLSGGAEGVTGAGAFGGVAASGLRGLAQQNQKGIEYTAGLRRQGAIEEKTNALNLVSAFQEEMQRIAAQQSANRAQLQPQLQGMMWDRDQQLWERGMMEDEAAQSEELNNWFRRWLKMQMGAGGGGGGQTNHSGNFQTPIPQGVGAAAGVWGDPIAQTWRDEEGAVRGNLPPRYGASNFQPSI